MKYVIVIIFIAVFLTAVIKKVNAFNAFTRGVGEAVNFCMRLLPLLVAIFITCELFERSHLSAAVQGALSPVFGALGIPEELTKLILIKPFSGSGSIAYLTDILNEYGADSYVGRCACVLFGSSETVFYISAVYFAKNMQKKRLAPIIIVLITLPLTAALACILCRIM